MSRSRVLMVVLFCAALLVPISAAQASYSLICTGYTSCADKGYSHSGYATHKSTSYWRMYTGTNCTNYVAYRLVTTNGMPNERPRSGVGNAEDWGFAMASITDSTPVVGSVAWWGRTGHHVAYVEKVVSSSEIWVSESNWSGAFDWRKITKSGSGWPDGFIHFKDLKLVNNVRPTISGVVKVGGALTAWGGDWTPKGNTYVYRWRADGVNIPGAEGKTFTPTAAQLGKQLSVSVTASRPSYPTLRAYSVSKKVAPGTLKATVAPEITGTARVDSTLSASVGTWSPTGATYAFQWNVDGNPVTGATGATYTPGPAEVGRRVTVTVTASKLGYDSVASTSTPTAELAPGPLTATIKPSITGTPKVGLPLSAHHGTWSKPDLTFSYQWFVDGSEVSGADSATFVPRAADVGLPVTVHVTASRAGYATTTAISPQTTPVERGTFRLVEKPAITGNHTRVGSRLTATTGQWSPGGTYTYTWYADGKPITGATSQSFIPTSRQLGAKIRVRVFAHRAGYATASALADNTERIERGRIQNVTAPRITGTARLGSSVAVSPGEHTPSGATLRYQWLRDGKVLTGATGRTRKITVGDLGHKLSARVRFAAPGYTAHTVTTAPTGWVKARTTIGVSATPGTRRVSFTIKVTAAGLPAPDGTVQVRFDGDHYRTVTIVDGRGKVTLTNQASGPHAYVFTLRGTLKLTSATYRKTVTIS
ncbi:CHAP domain-containing protein [Aeromicrobium sp. Root344]|uniref:CHAP domain-containing protein n=1 Tax=Aeromicrobium sp. Root344 TaxID=1736521 RepID=UPI000B141FB4|nr:CHAP domain-containing protein [Aeromicrobium sp. Root344]